MTHEQFKRLQELTARLADATNGPLREVGDSTTMERSAMDQRFQRAMRATLLQAELQKYWMGAAVDEIHLVRTGPDADPQLEELLAGS